MGKNPYLGLAEDDYRYYMKSRECGFNYNGVLIIGQQYIEKALKGILRTYTTIDKDDEVFKTHSIRRLISYVKQYITIPKDLEKSIKLADGYYFNARYPGDSYTDPEDSDFEDMDTACTACCEFVNFVKRKLNGEVTEKASDILDNIIS